MPLSTLRKTKLKKREKVRINIQMSSMCVSILQDYSKTKKNKHSVGEK